MNCTFLCRAISAYTFVFIFSYASSGYGFYLMQEDWSLIKGRSLSDQQALRLSDAYLSQIKENGRDVLIEAREFANGNTLVRFTESVVNRKVAIFSSFKTGDHIMEALMSIRTARTEGARKIVLVLDKKPNSQERRWIFEAGADSVLYLSHKNDRPDRLKTLEAPDLSQASYFKKSDSDLADAHPVVLGLSNQPLAAELAERLKIPYFNSVTDLDSYTQSSSTPLSVILVSSPSKEVNAHFFELLRVIRHFSKQNISVTTVTPYLPYARSDKIDQTGVTIGGRLIADLIEGAGTKRIAFVRLHAPQSQGFFKIPSIHVNGRKTIDAYLSKLKVEGIISPDAGFQKEAGLYARELGVKVFVINKFRDPQTGLSSLETMGSWDVAGRRVAIIDDETATGGTLAQSADFVVQNGAKEVIAVITHLTADGSLAINNANVSQIVATNTFEVPEGLHQKFQVLSIAPELADALSPFITACTKAFSNEVSHVPTNP